VNIKLDKAGGIRNAYKMLVIAKSLGMKTMLGCMVSSSCTVTAAAHLSPLVDYADLDGNLLIANDPYEGVKVEKGRLILPKGPGLGLKALLPIRIWWAPVFCFLPPVDAAVDQESCPRR